MKLFSHIEVDKRFLFCNNRTMILSDFMERKGVESDVSCTLQQHRIKSILFGSSAEAIPNSGGNACTARPVYFTGCAFFVPVQDSSCQMIYFLTGDFTRKGMRECSSELIHNDLAVC